MSQTTQSDTAERARVRKHEIRCLAALFFVFGLLVFRVTIAHAQVGVDEPFGLTAFSVPETTMAGTWNDLLVEIDNDLAVVKMCREEHQSCSSKAAKEFIALAKEGKGQEGLAKIGHINRAATLAIKALGTAPAEWRSPLAILSSGRGDCKHYAVLKYALLRALGFSTDALRIVVVDVRSTHELHAIASVRTENGRWLILDNLTLLLVESSVALDRYDPLYELDQDGVRQFEVPSHSVQLAQALRAKGLSPFQHKEGL